MGLLLTSHGQGLIRTPAREIRYPTSTAPATEPTSPTTFTPTLESKATLTQEGVPPTSTKVYSPISAPNQTMNVTPTPTSNGEVALQPKDTVALAPDDDAAVVACSDDEISPHIQQEEMQSGHTDVPLEDAGIIPVDAQDTAVSSEAPSQATAASANVKSNVAAPARVDITPDFNDPVRSLVDWLVGLNIREPIACG